MIRGTGYVLDVIHKKWDEILLLMKEENDITDIAF